MARQPSERGVRVDIGSCWGFGICSSTSADVSLRSITDAVLADAIRNAGARLGNPTGCED
ncbi:unnamed protein product [Clonostachys solani]|uniref:Uncharacterized protein n=1 Tax=Clonostachys solani TaxID=160281 RepID=A0A9N9Z1W3_9HYPO|nr:unnamed protein product [Clonostachys solani]